MKAFFGLSLIFGGIILGVYVGVWVMFVGGIVQCIEQVRAENMQATILAYGILKIISAGFIGWGTAILLVIPGVAVLKK